MGSEMMVRGGDGGFVRWCYQVVLLLLQTVSWPGLRSCPESRTCHLSVSSRLGRTIYCSCESLYIGASPCGMPSIWCIGREIVRLSPSLVRMRTDRSERR